MHEFDFFKQISEELPSGILVYTKEEVFYSNPSLEKLLGVGAKRLKEDHFFHYIAESDKESFISSIEVPQTRNNSTTETLIEVLTPKGKEIYLKAITKRIDYRGKEAFLTILINMQSEKKTLSELQKMAYYDPLTKLYNRRKFMELYDYEIKRCKRYDEPLSLMLFDIDHFKKVNDTYGHDVGDSLLSIMASVVSDMMRTSDHFARWGGEEFIVLLPQTQIDDAKIVAEHVRKSVEAIENDKIPKITVSIGVTQLKPNERLATLLKRVDKALYEAKTQGRNRVCF